MKILLFGRNGQLGWELERALSVLGPVAALGFTEVDLANAEALSNTVRELHPEVIVNAAAYTSVDLAESETDRAFAINGRAPGILAEEAAALDAVLIHYSTDYVFDGTKGAPYTETDKPNPLNAYGRSKLAGEEAIIGTGGPYLIFRTAWVYSTRRDSFVTRVLRWARQKEILHIVDDQVSNPTWARPLAEATALILARGKGYVSDRQGMYHLAGDGTVSRYGWAQEIIRLDPHPHEQVCRQLLPAATADFPAPAARPLHSALVCDRFKSTFGLQLPEWSQALALAMRE